MIIFCFVPRVVMCKKNRQKQQLKLCVYVIKEENPNLSRKKIQTISSAPTKSKSCMNELRFNYFLKLAAATLLHKYIVK